jgi:hypothetical protein
MTARFEPHEDFGKETEKDMIHEDDECMTY